MQVKFLHKTLVLQDGTFSLNAQKHVCIRF